VLLDEESLLSDDEIDSFLGRHETGVISLARENKSYAVPISYGYDSDHRRFYLRLISNPESEKREFLDSSPHTRLVVYEEDDPVYTSVVATGTLTEISRDELTVEHMEQYGEAKRPLFELWGESLPDLNVELYRLDSEELSGRRAEIERDAESS
jgi:nitroimidazol reductase NimA-like FMN-containing flavoprotein (pyridoxamine 5'-phosphate oxidase superfamily)